jgi:pyruvate dehydrogenase E1 component
MACGAMIPEAVEASEELLREGVFANIINITGPGPLYRHYQDSVRSAVSGNPKEPFMSDSIPTAERKAPVVTVADGHPHSLAWLGGALGTTVTPLGVTEFGQSGSRTELYKEYAIDVDSIIAACFTALDI